jgi:multiple sugar transport system substrate-binding protein
LSRVRRLALVCLAVLLAGCVQAQPALEPATISFGFPEVDAAHYETLVAKFAESHPQITVELHPRSWQQLYSPEAQLTDVYWVGQDLVSPLSEQNKIVDLGPLIEQDERFDLADLHPGMVDALSTAGQTLAIPVGANLVVMYYNRDLFDQYNVPYPEIGWTWDDFLERAVALRDPDAFVFGYGPRLDLNDALFFVYQHGGQIFDDLEAPTRTTFDDLPTIEALDWYARLVHDYDAAPSLNQSSASFGGGSYSVYMGILTDKVGMWMGGLSEQGGLTWPRKWTMAWGMVPLPRETHAATQAMLEGLAISSRTEEHEACWTWIAWLSRQVPYRLVPARRSLAASADYEKQAGTEVAKVARAALEDALIVDTMALAPFEAEMEVLGEALREILQGHKSPLEAMTEAQRKASR